MSGPGESAKEIRMPSQKCHPASQVASVVSVKPQAAAAARTDVTIARQVGGEQCEAVAHRFQADLVGAPGRGSVLSPVSGLGCGCPPGALKLAGAGSRVTSMVRVW